MQGFFISKVVCTALIKEQEDRYFFNLLYENVNDGPTRGRIIDSMGLCPNHAWALQARELEEWNDGLCLPQLREVLKITKDKYPAYLLIEKAEKYLKSLDKNLKEYIRKHAWDFRLEPKYAAEQASWIRAVAFFAGEYRGNSTDRALSSKSRALNHYNSYLHRASARKNTDEA